VQYEIVSGASTDELSRKVSARLKDGWEPLGGLVCVLATPKVPAFMQAIIKK